MYEIFFTIMQPQKELWTVFTTILNIYYFCFEQGKRLGFKILSRVRSQTVFRYLTLRDKNVFFIIKYIKYTLLKGKQLNYTTQKCDVDNNMLENILK